MNFCNQHQDMSDDDIFYVKKKKIEFYSKND